jgi:N-acetyl-anhydromuramyl-L-alanine amidase AmpD
VTPIWVGCAPANVAVERAGFVPDAIVLHRADGSLADLQRRMRDAASASSSHYGVALDGRVEQYVSETDSAFHAGVAVGATWRGIRPNVNPNFHTIGITHEGRANDPWPEAMRSASAALLAQIADRWAIPVDAEHVVPHSAIRASMDCPGAGCPIGDLISRSQAVIAGNPGADARVRTVTARVALNLRSGRPSRTSPIAGTVPAGSTIEVRGFTGAGESVDTNPFWYVDETGRFLWAGATGTPLPWAASADPPAVVTTDEMDLAARRAPAPASGAPPIDRTSLALAPKDYVDQRVAKDLIVLHFTAGSTAASAVSSWRSTSERVATAYLIDRDGTIHEVFPPDRWAHHLGIKGGTAHERRSIGIEIVNFGPLRVHPDDPGVLSAWPNDFRQRYCRRDETDRYLTADYRGERHFATYAEPQLDATGALVRWLCETFSIRRALPVGDRRLACDPAAFASYTGVATHVNFRNDKWDVGPAFPWDRLGL